jgi:hypothetical protein
MRGDIKRDRNSVSVLPTLAPPRRRWLEITLTAACVITVPLLAAAIGLGFHRSEVALVQVQQAVRRKIRRRHTGTCCNRNATMPRP